MTRKLGFFFIFVIITGFFAGTQSFGIHNEQEAVSVDAGLFSQASETLSIVVTADSSTSAARAVEKIGGQVTQFFDSEDAVAAIIPASQLDALVIFPDVRSITGNPDA